MSRIIISIRQPPWPDKGILSVPPKHISCPASSGISTRGAFFSSHGSKAIMTIASSRTPRMPRSRVFVNPKLFARHKHQYRSPLLSLLPTHCLIVLPRTAATRSRFPGFYIVSEASRKGGKIFYCTASQASATTLPYGYGKKASKARSTLKWL